MRGVDGDVDHPIMPDAYAWDLIELTYRCDPTDWQESYIDLVFIRGDVQRRLRFYAPRDLELSRGLPNSSGMCILDVTQRQIEGLRVRVDHFEQASGVPRFWAARVVEITE